METINSTTPTPPAPEQGTQAAPVTPAKQVSIFDTFKNLSIMNKILISFAGGMLLLVLLLLILVPKGPRGNTTIKPSVVPSSVAVPSPVAKVPSEFSKTEGFQKFEQNLNTITTDNAALDLSEEKLAFPLLDMKVTFEK